MTTQTYRIEATMHAAMYQPPIGCPVWHTVADAAQASGASAAAIRRAARRAGVARISGRCVAGHVALRVGGRVGYLPYAQEECS